MASAAYSMGASSRDYKIKSTSDLSPGPGNYELNSSFNGNNSG